MARKSTKNRGFSGTHTRARKPSAKSSSAKVLSLPEVLRLVAQAKKARQTIVTTNGCFDILHIGHVRYLREARRHGDILIVGVNSDASVRRNKGPKRPIVTAKERAEIIAELDSVDATFIFGEETPIKWLSKIKPHVHVKGADRTLDKIVEKSAVEKYGGTIIRANYIKNHSTTDIIGKIRKS